jgi:hypothetical protein
MRIEPIAPLPLAGPQDRVARKPVSTTLTVTTSKSGGAAESAKAENSLKMMRETDDKKNTVYRLVDDNTGTVISQVPSQQVLSVEDSIEQLLQQEIQKPTLDVKS